MNNSFFDDNEMREIDRQIDEQLGKPTLVENMQQKSQKIESAKKNLGNEIKEYWYIYLPLFISGIFTAMLGIYMGLAPYLKTNLDGSRTIEFNTDWGHVITAFIYVISFLFVTEVSFAIAHDRFHKREEGNHAQTITMIIAMIIAAVSVIGTGWSGGTVVASTLGFLTEFKEIPASAQKWVVTVIPALLGIYSILYVVYKTSSRKAKAERIARENREKMELDNRMRMESIQLLGDRKIQIAAIQIYQDLVMRGLLSPQEADWALKSGKSLIEIEKLLNRDLTGEGKVGDASGLSRPAPKAMPADNLFPMPSHEEPLYHPLSLKPSVAKVNTYTLEDVAKFNNLSLEVIVTAFQEVDTNPISASLTLTQMKLQKYVPNDMLLGNFVDLLNQARTGHPVGFGSNGAGKVNP